ncbi:MULTISPECIES: DUF1289 domain-containing protein [unclassified Acinetobacter]|uniref:DUF1289 domain-containing protein n=1 Tax=unclassified Acinetobacter TaxID=196816 RepID=UPI002934661E|nr:MULTISPECIES: DUF1289 domain-containing protein [unclassified Acinetobacter]WOE31405.1 DUF1289 domain-containing protein [Acinetobacter sp. SAAs470]WOE39601.1 DUF1289 domain-containing protein [Acinetobacter sp. SAAs474]
MSNDGRLTALTPCAGRCSTVFGDAVCRGCRRFNHEVIYWNTYSAEQQTAVWLRLDVQLDQILIPMLPHANLDQVERFIDEKRVRWRQDASSGRKLYHALKLCQKNKNFLAQSGLAIEVADLQPLWQTFEQRILALAIASYDLAFLRADRMHLDRDDI